MKKESIPPLYKLDIFDAKALEHSFYIESFKSHLKKHKFVSRPHNHDFYLLLYITEGSGSHKIDFNRYPVKPQSFFLMTPGQVHSWNLDDSTDGYILFFERSFYQMRLEADSLLEFPFFHSLQSNPLIELPPEEHSIEFLIKEMLEEFKRSTISVDLRIMRSYLDLLLLKLARHYRVSNQSEHTSSAIQKIRKLEMLIDQHYRELKQARDYASLLHISPAYLNSICKKTVGHTLTELISDRLVLETKRLLSYSDLTVGQMANHLNFSSASYFIRFFKKHTGQSPEQFKKSLNSGM